MAYREDPDLEFLGDMAEDADLNDLVRIITTDKDGKTRYAESLTNSAAYKSHYPKHKTYWQDIAAEVQTFGGNSVVNVLRRKGVLYKEILLDVAERLKVNVHQGFPTEMIEEHLMMGVLQQSLDKMTHEELDKFKNDLNIGTKVGGAGFGGAPLLVSLQAAFQAGGAQSYQLALIVVNSVMKAAFGNGMALVGNAAMLRAAGALAGPIGLGLSGLFAAISIAGPAMRVTIPVVFEIALLRKRHQLQVANLFQDIEAQLKSNMQ